MDTKLKKSHKLTTIIITLCILIPAFLIVLLYPRIRNVMTEKIAEYEQKQSELVTNDWSDWELEENFTNYAMEASYYLYAMMMEEDVTVLEQYGWINDYWVFHNNAKYHAVYDDGVAFKERKNTDVITSENTLAYMTLSFDKDGLLSEAKYSGDITLNLGDCSSIYEVCQKSVAQFKNNYTAYENKYETGIHESQYMPTNFTISIAIEPESEFLCETGEHPIYYYSYEGVLYKTGAIIILGAMGILVALLALVLPFFKRLDTGWEKVFCMPFEIVVTLTTCGVFATLFMYSVMAYTCGTITFPKFEILGIAISNKMCFITLLVLNFLGWALIAFIEYIAVTSLRQLITRPLFYLKNRLLIVLIARFLIKLCIKLYHYVTDIKWDEKLNKSILKIVLVNAAILLFLCALWLGGTVGIIIYSIVLFILLKQYGEKLQKQYKSVLQATQQMAEGNLQISLEEELGMFEPIGDSLERVQQGFQKALVEEAKSQSMKTELITNVSHDLKTPLTAIITYVDLLKKEDISEEERKAYIETLEQKSQRLKVLIEDLFEVSKAHSGNVTMNFMDVDVVSLMKQVKSEMADQMEASNLTFRFNLPEEKIILSLDGQRTYRIFENLLNNILKYAMPHTRVYIDLVNDADEVKMIFRNISAQELVYEPEQLTERFVRGDRSRQSEGSGLGLAIAKSFMELQNGKLNVEIEGDLFKVILTWKK